MLNFPKLSVIIVSAALGVAAIATSQAHASTVIYDFTVNVTQGSLAGQTFDGTFSYDDSTLSGTGVEELGVEQGLKVCMNYAGRNYSETDDTSYPTFPKIVFENGKIKQLDFWIQPQKRVVWWNLPGWNVNMSMRQDSSATVPICEKEVRVQGE